MELGAFSVSLAVKDMAASRDFYAKLGFEMFAGDGETWTIMANQAHVIGLFYGMFDSNILTFNPGWVGLGEAVDEFTDIRVLGEQLKAEGLALVNDTTDEAPSGSASFSIVDPDGNVILLDQHAKHRITGWLGGTATNTSTPNRRSPKLRQTPRIPCLLLAEQNLSQTPDTLRVSRQRRHRG